MPGGEVHPAFAVDDCGLQRFSQLDEVRDRFRCARDAVNHDHGVLGGDQHFRHIVDRSGIGGWRYQCSQLRDAQIGFAGHFFFLQIHIEDKRDGHHRRSHRNFVRTHHGLGKMRQRMRRVIPLRHITDEGRRVHGAVGPGHFSGSAFRGVEDVAENHDHRNAVTECIVDSHRCVLRSDSAVTADQRGLACDLGVTVGHRGSQVFVGGEDELRVLVLAVVDDRFLQGHVRIGRNAEHVLEAQALDDVHHEVGAGLLDGLCFIDHERCGRRRRSRQNRCCGVCRCRSSLLGAGLTRSGDSQSRACGRGLQEITTIYRF